MRKREAAAGEEGHKREVWDKEKKKRMMNNYRCSRHLLPSSFSHNACTTAERTREQRELAINFPALRLPVDLSSPASDQ